MYTIVITERRIMNNPELTISNAISIGWQKTKANYALVMGSAVVAGVILGAFSILENIASFLAGPNKPDSTVVIFSLIGLLVLIARLGVQNLLQIGLTRIQLNVVDDKPVQFEQLFVAEGLFWRYLGASILVGLIVFGGLLLLIVPGIIWAIKYQFALPLVVDKKLDVITAIKTSGTMTKGHKGWLFGFAIVLGLLNIAGFLAFGVGLLFTIPITIMAQIYVYRQLESAKSTEINASQTKSTK